MSKVVNSPHWISVPLGIRIHFCNGVHVLFPQGQRLFHLRISSLFNGQTIFDNDIQSLPLQPTIFVSKQTYCVPWKIEIMQNGKHIFLYHFNVTGKHVCVDMMSENLGDIIAWMSACISYQKEFNCKMTILMPQNYIAVFESVYPKINFITRKDYKETDFYATFPLTTDASKESSFSPVDFRQNNMVAYAGNILALSSLPQEPPLLAPTQQDDTAKYGKYVCLNTNADATKKLWHTPDGWKLITDELIKRGYRVLCIDDNNQNMPPNAEDFTEKLSLQEKINLLRGAKFMIGLSSSLSWLGWACKIPVILISGCTETFTEFNTPYRIINADVCHGCCNRINNDNVDSEQCPDKLNFTCTRSITPDMVIQKIDTVEKDLKK